MRIHHSHRDFALIKVRRELAPITTRVRSVHKVRTMRLGREAALGLAQYVERFRGTAAGPLFLTTDHVPMSSGHSLCVILQRLGERAGVDGVHPHRFRHTFATWAIESGAREIDVQMLLGHSDLTMTQRYARTYTSEQAVRAHAALSPVNRLSS